MLTVVRGAAGADDPRGDGGGSSLIDEIVRDGARRTLAEALQAEVDAYLAQFIDERDENGRRLVVRNGSHQPNLLEATVEFADGAESGVDLVELVLDRGESPSRDLVKGAP